MKQTIRKKLIGWLSEGQQIIEDGRGAPESIANLMDAASINSALINAEQGNVADLWNLYDSIIAGDPWLQAMLQQRKLASLSDVITIEAEDPKDPLDIAAAQMVDENMRRLRRFRMGTLSHLMDGVIRPVSCAEMVFVPDHNKPGKYMLNRVVNVPHFCEDFTTGKLAILKQQEGNAGRTSSETYPVERGRHIVHRGHTLTAPDCWGGPMRALVFLWLLRTCNREWWARSLERWGAPIPVGKYPAADKSAKLALQSAFSRFTRMGGLVISDATSVDLIAGPAAGNGDAWEKMQNWAERQITVSILGQDLSSGAQPTGLGSGVADLHGRVRDDLILMDEMALAETLTNDFAAPIIEWNGMPGHCKVVIGSGTNLSKAAAISDILSKLGTAGLEADDPAITELAGLMGIGLRRQARPLQLPNNLFSQLTRRS